MSARRIDGRTRLAEVFCHSPLQVLRAGHTEPDLPDLASVIICSPAGGVLQGDRLRMEVHLEAGSRLRLETQSSTRVYASPDDFAGTQTALCLDEDSYLEYVPDPLIPYAGADYHQVSSWEVDRTATLIVGEVIAAGREAREERVAFRRVETSVEARRPDGEVIFRDASRLVPRPELGLSMLGGSTALGSLFVVSSRVSGSCFSELGDRPELAACQMGWSDLPNQSGAWFKVLAADSARAAAAVRAAWQSARLAVLGRGLPPARRF